MKSKDLSELKEIVVARNNVVSHIAMKIAYFSLAAMVLIFVSMLLLTGLHP